MTGYPTFTEAGESDRRRSKSIGSATPEVGSRQYDRRSADQRRDSSCPSYNMN